MKAIITGFMVPLALAGMLLQARAGSSETNSLGLVPLPIQYPEADMSDRVHFYLAGIKSGPNIEPFPTNAWRQLPPAFMGPPGATNVAMGKKVTTSATRILTGRVEQVTDGRKGDDEADCVTLQKGKQWVQVDLGRSYSIVAVAIWHENLGIQRFHDVVVQLADDAGFTNDVHTLFNNDTDGSSGLGRGTDKEYYETRWGKVIDGKGIQARYVRSYTDGGNFPFNVIEEIEVYAVVGAGSGTPERPTSRGTE